MAIKSQSTKAEQLLVLLKKPNGVRSSTIVDKFGWQAHTVRAAICGLRKKGFAIRCSKSVKSGEAVYAIVDGDEEVSYDALKAMIADGGLASADHPVVA